MLKAGWYVLLYHDVAWEETPYARGIGGQCPPELFREHVTALAKVADLTSLDAGYEAWRTNRIRRPTISFWFDDGLAGVRKYALPILEQHGITSGISVCSRFTQRTEMFWRFKLSFLSDCDGLRLLRSRWKQFDYPMGESLKNFSLDRFSPSILEELNRVYESCTTETQRADAFRIFDTREGIAELRKKGWVIANHSAAHYPLGETTAIDLLDEQFTECNDYLVRELEVQPEFWVIPFERASKRAGDLRERFAKSAHGERLVLCGNEVNRPDATDHTMLHRIYMPMEPPKTAIRFLHRLPYAKN